MEYFGDFIPTKIQEKKENLGRVIISGGKFVILFLLCFDFHVLSGYLSIRYGRPKNFIFSSGGWERLQNSSWKNDQFQTIKIC
jgi:hypothetical protein